MRPFQIRMSRHASISDGACVHSGSVNSLWWNPGERRERGGARLTRRVREEYRVYFDRNATQNGAKRSGSAGMHRRSNAAWVLPQAVKRELVSIRDSDTRGMRLLHIRHASYSASANPGHASISHSAKPACVHFRRGMRLFQLRLNASLRLFRGRMSGACVYIGLDSTPACVHFRLGRSRHASITASDTRCRRQP